jgi:hypothetical protein
LSLEEFGHLIRIFRKMYGFYMIYTSERILEKEKKKGQRIRSAAWAPIWPNTAVRGKKAGVCLLAAGLAFLGLGLTLGSAQWPGSGEGARVYGRLRLTAGLVDR